MATTEVVAEQSAVSTETGRLFLTRRVGEAVLLEHAGVTAVLTVGRIQSDRVELRSADFVVRLAAGEWMKWRGMLIEVTEVRRSRVGFVFVGSRDIKVSRAESGKQEVEACGIAS